MMTYWPWWLGSLALGGVTVGFWLLLRRPLGISGSWSRILAWRESRAVELAEIPFRANVDGMGDALLAATLAEFGDQAMFQNLASTGVQTVSPSTALSPPSRAPWTVHLTFLTAMFVGGLIAAIYTGHFALRLDMGRVYTQLFGNGWQSWIILMLGGSMVGFGTQMAGGCTSGHGLSGCSRLVPASLLATSIFFGSAVGISFLAEVLAK